MIIKRFSPKNISFFTAILLCWFYVETTNAQATLWKFAAGAAIHSTPAISNQLIYFGSADSNFYALSKSTGKLTWKFKTKGQVHSSPAIYQNSVLFSSTDGYIYALDKTNGNVNWIFKTKGEKKYDLWDYFLSSPVVNNHTIYIGSGDGNIYAIDASTGKMLWAYQTQGIVHASPVVNGNKVITGSYDGQLYTLDAKTGKLIWKFKTVGDVGFPNGEIQKAVTIHDSTIFFGSRDYNIYALNLKTGTGNWNMKERGSWVIASPLVYNANVYFGTSDTHRFYCMNATSGEIKWTIPLAMRVYGTATNIDGEIVFGCFNGKIYFVDPETGTIKSTFQTDESKLAYHTLFDDNDKLKAEINLYGPDYLKVEQSILALGSILCTPVIENQVLYFGDANGFFYALNKPELKK